MTAPIDAPGGLDRAGRPRARPADRRRRAVRRPPRDPRVERGPAAAAGARPRRRRTVSSTRRRRAPRRRARRQPRVDTRPTLRFVLPVARRRRRRSTSDDVAHRRRDAAEADARRRTSTSTAYTSTRMWATAPDGTQVPVDVVHHVGTPRRRHRTVPALRLRLLRGVDAAVVLGRRGSSLLDRGSCGRSPTRAAAASSAGRWYLDGKLLHKRNTFTDTIACAEHLVAAGWRRRRPRRHPRRQRRRPAGRRVHHDAPRAVRRASSPRCPFVDVVTTMSDPTLPLTVTEWEEWGDPRSRAVRQLHAALLPLRQHRPRPTYPALYVTAGLNDPRVSYHEPAKWVAKLRAVGADATRRCCCAPRWAPATAARAAATTPGATRPAPSPSSSSHDPGTATRTSSSRASTQREPIRAALRTRWPGADGWPTTHRSTRTADGGPSTALTGDQHAEARSSSTGATTAGTVRATLAMSMRTDRRTRPRARPMAHSARRAPGLRRATSCRRRSSSRRRRRTPMPEHDGRDERDVSTAVKSVNSTTMPSWAANTSTPILCPSPRRRREQYHVVVVGRIVVEQGDRGQPPQKRATPRTRPCNGPTSLLPTNSTRRVLGIVDQQVGAAQQRSHACDAVAPRPRGIW